MTTIGQRIKNFRKNSGLSQAELAGRIGVTPQTVSKWECDVGLPDIVQIIPLAEVLDVSCDAILGADVNMEKNIEAAFAEVDAKWENGIDNQSVDRTDMHRTFDYYNAARELFRRYPTNFRIAMYGAKRGGWLLGRLERGMPEIEGFDPKSVLREVEKMCRTIINYNDDIRAKLEAKSRLGLAYYSVGDFDRAKEEFEGLPATEYNRARHAASIYRTGNIERIATAKEGFGEACVEFLFWLRAIADSYSAAAMREETYKACFDLISFCERFNEFCDGRDLLYYKRVGYLLIAQNRIRGGDYDGALDAIESLTDCVVEYKKSFGDESRAPKGSIYFEPDPNSGYRHPGAPTWFDESLMWAVSDFADKENNPVVASERYRECCRRIKEMK